MPVDEANFLKDFSGAAAGYFGGIRVPASMIAGTCLSALFLFSKNLKLYKQSKVEFFLIRCYHILILLSFMLSLSTVVIATAASVSILHARFNPMAETAYMLLRKEFDFEFCLTRWSFLVSLLGFIAGVTVRIILEFQLHDGKPNQLMALVLGMLSLIFNLLSYVNRTLYCWGNLFEMTIYVIQMLIERALEEVTTAPLRIMSVLSTVGAILFLLRAIMVEESFSTREIPSTSSSSKEQEKQTEPLTRAKAE